MCGWEFIPIMCGWDLLRIMCSWDFTNLLLEPKHLKEPKHSTTVKNQNTSQQYCTVLLLVFVSLLVLLDFYSRISGMSTSRPRTSHLGPPARIELLGCVGGNDSFGSEPSCFCDDRDCFSACVRTSRGVS